MCNKYSLVHADNPNILNIDNELETVKLKEYFESITCGNKFINIEEFRKIAIIEKWKTGKLLYEFLKWKRNLRKIYFEDFGQILEIFHENRSFRSKIKFLFEVILLDLSCS